MGILDITNRTENWQTVKHFHGDGLSDAAKVGLARLLGEPDETTADDIKVELFWRGMRDYAKKNGVLTDDLVASYGRMFGGLRDEIDASPHTPRFRDLRSHNYTVPVSMEHRENLANNLKNTEVDIVLETPRRILIGEGKYRSPSFGTSRKYVLVHQLIRQYVTATILVDLVGGGKAVVPFIVAERSWLTGPIKGQIAFMKQKWLCEDHVLTWEDVGCVTRQRNQEGAER